jgi:integrase
LTAAVFRNSKGVRWNYRALYRRMEYWKTKLGIECDASTHGIRHRFGTAAVAAGAPIKLISHMMGHASVATTERYYVNLDGEMDAIREAAKLALPR